MKGSSAQARRRPIGATQRSLESRWAAAVLGGRRESWWRFAQLLAPPRGGTPLSSRCCLGRKVGAGSGRYGGPLRPSGLHLAPVPPAGIQAVTAPKDNEGRGREPRGAGQSSRGFLGTGLGKTAKFWSLPAV